MKRHKWKLVLIENERKHYTCQNCDSKAYIMSSGGKSQISKVLKIYRISPDCGEELAKRVLNT